MTRALVLDGYIDEPGSLGVPPYIHPLVRVTYGACLAAGIDPEYRTIDQWRSGNVALEHDLLVVLAGMSVPGRYLRGMPASRRELIALSECDLPNIIGGPAALDKELAGRYGYASYRDAAAATFDIIKTGETSGRWRTVREWNDWSLRGADCVTLHPDFPQPLIAEIETYRGCIRYLNGGCSFCVEPTKGRPVNREPADIISEVRRLHDLGVRNFRLGGQTCFISYMAHLDESDCPRPNPEAVEELLSGISSLRPTVLHVDNANPAVIARHPEESGAILRSLVEHCTAGNVLALGMESADPEVVRRNNLNATPDEVHKAIEMINAIGGDRGESGLPRLLPGINLLIGLDGETDRTLAMNIDFLRKVMDDGHMLRRINIRQVSPVRREFKEGVNHSKFLRFKQTIRSEIDRPMLRRLVPEGTILRNVFLEMAEGKVTYGRQIGSYPLLVGVPYPATIGSIVDVVVTGHGYRSVTGVEYPLRINSCPLAALEALDGIGRKRAIRLFKARPLMDAEGLLKVLDDKDVIKRLIPIITFD